MRSWKSVEVQSGLCGVAATPSEVTPAAAVWSASVASCLARWVAQVSPHARSGGMLMEVPFLLQLQHAWRAVGWKLEGSSRRILWKAELSGWRSYGGLQEKGLSQHLRFTEAKMVGRQCSGTARAICKHAMSQDNHATLINQDACLPLHN